MHIADQHQLLDEIDERQEDLLRQLDALNDAIESTIASLTGSPSPGDPQSPCMARAQADIHSEPNRICG